MTDWVQKQLERIHGLQGQKGGPGSGHHGHAGRPGKRGGSVPGKGGESVPRRGKPIIPTRTKIHTLVREEGVTDPEELVQAVGVDEQWVRDIVAEELRREQRRRRPGIYVPGAVGWISNLDSEFKADK